jgi:hypothetical protein
MYRQFKEYWRAIIGYTQTLHYFYIRDLNICRFSYREGVPGTNPPRMARDNCNNAQ